MARERLLFEFDGDASKFKQAIQQSNKSVNNFGSNLTKIGGIIAGAFAVDKLIEFGSAIIETTSEFEKFEAVLTNTLGSKSQAQKALKLIKDFATETPFSVVELTDSFVRLANQGFKPTREQMRKLGDVASSTGKDFLQLSEAIIDAQVGEFERLKDFGIRASKEGDRVTFTFKEVETQVDFTASSIRDYIVGLGDIEGVSGSADAISKTLGGSINNLGDTFDGLKDALGQELKPVLTDVISLMSNLLETTTEFIKSGGIQSFFGKLFNAIKPASGALLQAEGIAKNTINEFEKLADTELDIDPPKIKFDTLKEFNKQFGTSFKSLSDITNQVQFDLFLANDTANMLAPTMRGVAEGFDIASLKTREYLTAVEESNQSQQQFALVTNIVTTGMNLMFDALSNPDAFDSFLKSIKQIVVQLLKQLAIMVAIAGVMALIGGTSFVKAFKAVSGLGGGEKSGGGIGGLLGFAEGGIVTKPVMGMIGEAGQSEAVIPLNRLPQMVGAIGGNQKGEFTLRGQDLILALERAGDFRARITG